MGLVVNTNVGTGDDNETSLGVPTAGREANMDALTGNDTAGNSTLTDQQKQAQLDEVNAQRRANGLSEYNNYEDLAAAQQELINDSGATVTATEQTNIPLIPTDAAHASQLVRDGILTREQAEGMGFTLDEEVISNSNLGEKRGLVMTLFFLYQSINCI